MTLLFSENPFITSQDIRIYIYIWVHLYCRKSQSIKFQFFSHLKDFAIPFIITSVTMMMHLMSKSVRCLKTYQSVLGGWVSIFIPNICIFPKAGDIELGVFNQTSANLPDKCLKMCPFADGYAYRYFVECLFPKVGNHIKVQKKKKI